MGLIIIMGSNDNGFFTFLLILRGLLNFQKVCSGVFWIITWVAIYHIFVEIFFTLVQSEFLLMYVWILLYCSSLSVENYLPLFDSVQDEGDTYITTLLHILGLSVEPLFSYCTS